MLLGEPIHARTPRHVALALDGQATDPETLALAAAWREGEGLRFAVISFDPERDPPLLAEHRGPIDDAHLVVAGPTLVFARAGFRTEASGRTGGWYVLWLEQAGPGKRLVGTRIAQADPRAEPHFVIDTEADPRALFAFSSDSGTAEVGVVAGGGQPDLHIGSLGCAVSQ